MGNLTYRQIIVTWIEQLGYFASGPIFLMYYFLNRNITGITINVL